MLLFFIRLLRHLLSLPFAWASTLLSFFHVPASATLADLAGRISGRGDQQSLALRLMALHFGEPAALAHGRGLLARRPTADVAVLVGLMECNIGEADSARQCFALAQSLGRDREGLGELLEYVLSDRDGRSAEVLPALLRRSDLSPFVRRHLLTEQAWSLLSAGRLDQAADGARYLLSIDACAPASMLLWVLGLREGRDDPLHRRDGFRASSGYSPWTLAITGCFAVGLIDHAEQMLRELAQRDPAAAEQIRLRLQRPAPRGAPA